MHPPPPTPIFQTGDTGNDPTEVETFFTEPHQRALPIKHHYLLS